MLGKSVIPIGDDDDVYYDLKLDLVDGTVCVSCSFDFSLLQFYSWLVAK